MIGVNLPKVLFIKDVFKRDCVEDDFLEKKIIDTLNDPILISELLPEVNCHGDFIHTGYEKLPSLFETLEKWPKQTNLLCWHCSLPFDTIPVFIPKVIEPVISRTKKNKYSIAVYGVFCSFGDAAEFINTRSWLIGDRVEATHKLRHLYKIFYGKSINEYVSYPSIYEMIQYGGNITPAQYKAAINQFKSMEELQGLTKS